jgi:hypothetical protein
VDVPADGHDVIRPGVPDHVVDRLLRSRHPPRVILGGVK